MAERRNGSVIIVSSIGGLKGSSSLGTYGLSKAADMALARNLAVEWGPATCASTASRPDSCAPTSRARCGRTPTSTSERLQRYPLRRIGEPDEIAGTAVFLASVAGSFITGQTIVMDGGAT